VKKPMQQIKKIWLWYMLDNMPSQYTGKFLPGC
jgi:hypothetical protein